MISIEEIKHLEELSNLQFDQEERESFKKSFDAIIDFASQISQVKTDGQSFVKSIKLEDLREDQVKESLSQDKIISNAPEKRRGCFVVPKIME